MGFFVLLLVVVYDALVSYSSHPQKIEGGGGGGLTSLIKLLKGTQGGDKHYRPC